MMKLFVAVVLTILSMGALTFLVPSPAKAQSLEQIFGEILNQVITNEINKGNTPPAPPPPQQVQTPSQTAPSSQEPAMNRETRQQVQAALNLLGFDAGVEDGVLGRGSRAAIRAYQVANGAPGTGYLTSIQLRDLTNTYAQAVKDGNPELSRPLTKQEFQQLQTALSTLGYYTGAIDGIVGRGTSQAIYRYASDRGVDANTVSTAQILEMALAETTGGGTASDGNAALGGKPGFVTDFDITGNRLTVGLENLDPGQQYWVVLLDPDQQTTGIRQYYAYQTVSGGNGGQTSFDLTDDETQDVWLMVAENGTPILDKLTIRRPGSAPAGPSAGQPAGPVVTVDGVRVDFGRELPFELTGEPFSVAVSGLKLGTFFRVVIREMDGADGADGAVVWSDPNQVFMSTYFKVKITLPRAGSFRFDIEALSTTSEYVPIVKIPIEVVATDNGDEVFRWVKPPVMSGDYQTAGIKDDLFLGRYEGQFNCGPVAADWYGGQIEISINKVTMAGGRVESLGQITIWSRDGNKVLFSANAKASGSYFSDRLMYLYPKVDQTAGQHDFVKPFLWLYLLQFDNSFKQITLTPTRTSGLTKTECRTSKLTRTADSPVFVGGNPKAPQVTEFCRDTRSAEGVAACVDAAAKAWETNGVLIAINRLRDVIGATRSITPPQCSVMLENFDQVLFSITQEYGVPFGFEVKTCPQLLEVLGAMGHPRPAPEVCDVQRSINGDWLTSCLRALSDKGHETDVRSMLTKASNACINGPEGAMLSTRLPFVLAGQRVFSGGDRDRQAARISRELDCRDVVKVALTFGVGNAAAVQDFIDQANAAETYACSQERAETQPTRLDMINALGREIGLRCSPGFVLNSWLSGDGNDMSPFAAALFEFVPSEKSCQLRSRLNSIAAEPEFTFWAGGYESTQCQANGSGRFDCVGDFVTGFGSNDPRPGASLLGDMFVNKRNPLAASFLFDPGACEWRAVDIRQLPARP